MDEQATPRIEAQQTTGERLGRPVIHEITDDVAFVTTVMVNAYFIGQPHSSGGGGGATSGGWVLVDCGLPLSSGYIRMAAEERFGKGARPEAIILTHGHFDHVGSARDLARAWDCTLYAHPLELPYLTGKADYPPQDPTVGGAGGHLSRVYPYRGHDFGRRVQPLPEDGSLPGLGSEWRWVHTPGHTPGHVSLWRERDRLLIAGDAVVTTDLESWACQVTWRRELDHPPAYFTPDWSTAQASARRLAQLEPRTVASGHGYAMEGDEVAGELQRLAERFDVPREGRYVGRPAHFDETGRPVDVPPAAHDPWPARVAVGLAVAAGAWATVQARRSTRRQK